MPSGACHCPAHGSRSRSLDAESLFVNIFHSGSLLFLQMPVLTLRMRGFGCPGHQQHSPGSGREASLSAREHAADAPEAVRDVSRHWFALQIGTILDTTTEVIIRISPNLPRVRFGIQKHPEPLCTRVVTSAQGQVSPDSPMCHGPWVGRGLLRILSAGETPGTRASLQVSGRTIAGCTCANTRLLGRVVFISYKTNPGPAWSCGDS